MEMIVCEACGSVVHPDFLQLHSDWHDTLLTVDRLETVDNPPREMWPEFFVKDC